MRGGAMHSVAFLIMLSVLGLLILFIPQQLCLAVGRVQAFTNGSFAPWRKSH